MLKRDTLMFSQQSERILVLHLKKKGGGTQKENKLLKKKKNFNSRSKKSD